MQLDTGNGLFSNEIIGMPNGEFAHIYTADD